MSSPNSFSTHVVLTAVHRSGQALGPNYLTFLEAAFKSAPPVCSTEPFGKLFRLRGRDATWVASLLASNSYMEGYSAGRLWQYASTLIDRELALAVQRHASDEAKHSRMFGASLFKVFPTLRDDRLHAEVMSNAPSAGEVEARYFELDAPSDDELLSAMLLINLFEVKALFLGMLTMPVALAHAPENHRASLSRLFEAILADEARHITYSASYLESACARGRADSVASGLRDFQETMNLVTQSELEADFGTLEFSL